MNSAMVTQPKYELKPFSLHPLHHHAGVPRVVANSPLLYNILFVRDIPATLQTLTTDTVFWVSSTQTRHLVRNLTQIFTDYLVYCNEWRIKLNTATSYPVVQAHTDYDCFGATPPLASTCTYLGITLDSTLNFQKNLKK